MKLISVVLAFILGFLEAFQIYRPETEISYQKEKTIWRGPCWGQVGIANTFGNDIITVERERQVLTDAGLEACFDTESPQKYTHDGFVTYARVSVASRVRAVLFDDKEIQCEILSLVVYPPDNEKNPTIVSAPLDSEPAPKFPGKHWSWPGIPPKTVRTKDANVQISNAISALIASEPYKRVVQGSRPTRITIAERLPVRVWGSESPLDLYVNVNGKELRFQSIPIGQIVYCGRVDNIGGSPALNTQTP